MEKIKVYKTTGGCMRPLIKSSEFVFVLPQKRIRCGDVVLYNLFGNRYLHRVKEIRPDKIILVDDAGIISPVEISLENVIGVYPTLFSSFVGIVYNFFMRKIFIFFRMIKHLKLLC
jgi:hypothetical protein